MRDVIDCPTCGGQLIKAVELEEVYLCDVCGNRLEDGMHHAPKEADAEMAEAAEAEFERFLKGGGLAI